MASRIISGFAPTLENDMPESSMGRETQGITINQGSLRNLLECITHMLQQIQMNTQELGREGTQPATLQPGLPIEVVQEFQACLSTRLSTHLSSINCDRLLRMVHQYRAQLFLQTFDVQFFRTALHVGVLNGYRKLLHTLLELTNDSLPRGEDSDLAKHDFVLKADKFGLTAIDMAALIANEDIISCFKQSYFHQNELIGGLDQFNRSPISGKEKEKLLGEAVSLLEKQAPESSNIFANGQLSLQDFLLKSQQSSIREWLLKKDIDFVYCLHEAAVNLSSPQEMALKFVEFVCANGDSRFLVPLLNVRDSLGKSPLHVCNFEPLVRGVPYFKPCFKPLFEILVTHFPNLDLNMHDFSERTPLHWAAAQGIVEVVTFLVNRETTNLNATCRSFDGFNMKNNTNFNNDKVGNVTPLHLAVIHNHVEVVKALLKVPEGRGLDVNAICKRGVKFFDETVGDKYIRKWTPFQLAAYMGCEQILQVFLKDSRLYDLGLKNGKESAPQGHNLIPALHLATSQFHPRAVKALVDCRKMDILVRDKDENTALHYAAMHAHGRLQVHANLHDYVTVSHFTSKPPKSRKPSDHDIITCIDILMQSGLDMEQRNKEGTPTLHALCPEKVQNWWLQKMAREAQENKNNLIIAANAISVTAALVATASFVGPLQPPLGLLDDGSQTWLDGYSQVQHTSVEVFLFCNSLSFYLAIAAIVFAMLPSWPIPHEGLAQEVRIARRCVQVAVLLLFASIIFVVCAFSAANIAIVPNQQWKYKTIVVISTSLGVLICFLILFLSFLRLLTLISSRNEVAKKISNVATRIMLWERDTSFAK